MTGTSARFSSDAVGAGLAAWFVAALALGATGRLERLRAPGPQIVALGLAAALVVAGKTIPGLRAWAREVDPRALVAVHLTRFVGLYFLLLARRGQLPGAFAVPAGWGDTTVATIAAGLLATGGPVTVGRRRAYVAWNVLGLVDILLVVAGAARVSVTDPASMRAMLRLPLSLLPTCIVPLIIATHLLLATRLRRASG